MVFRDQLVKALLNYEEDEYFVFSDADRKEFLFRIFQFLVIGGPINQYEDEIGIYIEGTRSLYKDMVSYFLTCSLSFKRSNDAEFHRIFANIGSRSQRDPPH